MEGNIFAASNSLFAWRTKIWQGGNKSDYDENGAPKRTHPARRAGGGGFDDDDANLCWEIGRVLLIVVAILAAVVGGAKGFVCSREWPLIVAASQTLDDTVRNELQSLMNPSRSNFFAPSFNTVV